MLFADSGPWIPLPLRGVANYRVDTEEGYEALYRHLTNQIVHAAPELGYIQRFPPATPIAPVSYPSSPEARAMPFSKLDLSRRYRSAALKRVRSTWVDGVLNSSLYKIDQLVGFRNKVRRR